jgi:hypothetical protein
VWALLLLSGCAHTVEIRTEPSGAAVTLAHRGSVGLAPVQVKVWDIPLTRPVARIALGEYRTVNLDLRREIRPWARPRLLLMLRWRQAFARGPMAAHLVLLVPRHGPAGTWSAEEVPD